jgi:hypothetical protein
MQHSYSFLEAPLLASLTFHSCIFFI